MLHPEIYVSVEQVIQGCGLFSARLIKKGTLIWKNDESTFPLAEIKLWPAQKQKAFQRYGFQCGIDHFCLPEGASREMNHCCDPNTWWSDSCSLVARRDIQPQEEVTYDYASSEVALALEMTCRCGSDNCRGTITHLDYQLSSWQQQYGTYLPEHTLLAISNHRASIENDKKKIINRRLSIRKRD